MQIFALIEQFMDLLVFCTKWKKMMMHMLVVNSVLVMFILSNFNIVISWIASTYHVIVLQRTFGEQATLFVDGNEALFKLANALSPKHFCQLHI